jgi:hypothetical protein
VRTLPTILDSRLLLVFCLAVIGVISAQTKIVVSAVPLWPSTGDVRDYPNQYVFLELQTGDLVVSYPSSLLPDPNIGPLVTFRVHLPKVEVVPTVTVTCQQLSDGRYEYVYAIRNGSQKPITQWAIGAASFQGIASGGAEGWSTRSAVRIPGTENYYMPALINHHLIWSASGAQGMGAGASAAFTIVSPARPGFVQAHFQSGQVIMGNGALLPAVVNQQLQPLLDLEHGGTTLRILGPKYPPKLPPVSAAGDLYGDVSVLVKKATPSGASPFLRKSLKALKAYIDSAPVADDETRNVLVPGLATISSTPASLEEEELATALKTSLGINIAPR